MAAEIRKKGPREEVPEDKPEQVELPPLRTDDIPARGGKRTDVKREKE